MVAANLAFAAMVVVMLGLGAWLGHTLAGFEKLAPHKLLNVIGIVYGLLGVLVLAEFVLTSHRLKAFMVNWVAGLVLWAHTVIPLGVLVGTGIGHSLPSAGSTAKFFLSFLGYSLFVLAILEAVVVNVKAKNLQPVPVRAHAFGLILLLSSGTAQLIAALLDLRA